VCLSAPVVSGIVRDETGGVLPGVSVELRGPNGPPAVADSVRSKPTSLVNVEARYKLARNVRVTVDIFNLLNARDSDIDYFDASRLPGEPAGGVNDIHSHPAPPRTVRAGFIVAF
jgi:outer membrane receptor protein involved in Fe transport